MNSKNSNRVVLKLSGEALADKNGTGLDFDILDKISKEIKRAIDMDFEIAIVIGGGNFWRGRSSSPDMDRSTADYMGMLATVINSLALQSTLEKVGVQTRVMSAIEMNKIAEPYIRRKAVRHLEKKRVVIFAAGTGNPFFSTDMAAALRAAEINAGKILFAKNIDSVYDKDPKIYKDAKKIDKITYKEILDKELNVIDLTAVALLNENDIPICIFGLEEPNNIIKILKNEKIGTEIRRNF